MTEKGFWKISPPRVEFDEQVPTLLHASGSVILWPVRALPTSPGDHLHADRSVLSWPSSVIWQVQQQQQQQQLQLQLQH